MPQRIIEINLAESKGVFSIIKSRISNQSHSFSGVKELRQLLGNEKARILHVIKNEKPKSIYELAKKLNRGFKSVNDDAKLLEKFGFIRFIKEKTKNRKRLRPEIAVDKVIFHLNI